MVCGWRKGDVFSVSSLRIFLMLDASRQEKGNSVQALEMHAFYHGVALPKKIANRPWAFCHA